MLVKFNPTAFLNVNLVLNNIYLHMNISVVIERKNKLVFDGKRI